MSNPTVGTPHETCLPHPTERVLAGGLVAYNEERSLERAVASLLEQELPPGVRWGTIWIVASGCTDGTVPIAEELARRDPRIRVVVQAMRRGKSHAVAELLRRAEGDLLVLLNGDAAAEPGAVAALLGASEGSPRPFAIMGRPLPPERSRSAFARMVDLLWRIHHEFHREVPISPTGSNLSDELLLLSLPQPPLLREGIINDGAYLGLALLHHRGEVRYAPQAGVRISVPETLRDYLRQRRRILAGYSQLGREFGTRPQTLARLAFSDPHRALGVLARSLRASDHRLTDLAGLISVEVIAATLAAWDAHSPRTDHVHWKRIAAIPSPRPDPLVGAGGTASIPRVRSASVDTLAERRFAVLLQVARRYRTGLSVDELISLLPAGGPTGREELLYWLGARPKLARLEGDQVFPAEIAPAALDERRNRGKRYRGAADELVNEHLGPVLPWVRCLGITGSAAYGAPDRGDDLDFFVVTRPGSLWVFLTYTYLAVRFRFRPRESEERPMPCFNYVLDEREAHADFARPQGFLFAREALTTQILVGEEFYRKLLHTAPWLGEEIPRLYAARKGSEVPPAPSRAPAAIRLLNALLFPPVATYLHLVALRRRAELRWNRAGEGEFRVRTTFARLAYATDEFEDLRREAARAPLPDPDAPRLPPTGRVPRPEPSLAVSDRNGREDLGGSLSRRPKTSRTGPGPSYWIPGVPEEPESGAASDALRNERGFP